MWSFISAHGPGHEPGREVGRDMANDRTGRQRAVAKAEDAGLVADSMAVREALLKRVAAGEITLEQAQTELKAIKRGAKANGQMTQNQAYLRG